MAEPDSSARIRRRPVRHGGVAAHSRPCERRAESRRTGGSPARRCRYAVELFVQCVRGADNSRRARIRPAPDPRAARGLGAPGLSDGSGARADHEPAAGRLRYPCRDGGVAAAADPAGNRPGGRRARQDELMRAVLDPAVLNHPGLERLLTSVRAILLEAAFHANSEIAKEMLGFRPRSRANASSTTTSSTSPRRNGRALRGCAPRRGPRSPAARTCSPST